MYRWIRPLLFKLDAETAHQTAIRSAKLIQTLPGLDVSTTSANLEQDLFGIHFSNPIGIAAGLDKNAECLPYWARIGCGFAEVGSVSADPAPGNPRPRAFRLPLDRALVNRMGLNNDGAEVVVRRLPVAARRSIPIGINIVKTHRDGLVGNEAIEDFCSCYRAVSPHAGYVTLNVSCPNTADGKTFEEPEFLDALLTALQDTGVKRQPLLVKLSPPGSTMIDEGQYSEILSVILSHEIDGIVAANTASDRENLRTSKERIQQIGHGGLSGRPMAARSTSLIRFIYRKTDGNVPIIGVGGVDSPDEALKKIRAGASLVQLYTGLVYEGPGLIKRIVRGLARHLDRERKHLTEIIGVDA
jgi:dihydroorotate dehydrogenase